METFQPSNWIARLRRRKKIVWAIKIFVLPHPRAQFLISGSRAVTSSGWLFTYSPTKTSLWLRKWRTAGGAGVFGFYCANTSCTRMHRVSDISYDEQNKGIFIKLQWSSFPGPTKSSLIRNSSSATKAPGASVCMHGLGLKAAQRNTKECQIIALLNYCWLLLTATLLILLLEMKQTHTAHMHTCRRCCCFFVCYHRIFA